MDNGGSCDVLLTDLNTPFHCILHDIFIAKLEAYCFSCKAPKIMHGYLTDRKHRTKINSFNDFINLLMGLPQGLVNSSSKRLLGVLINNI